MSGESVLTIKRILDHCRKLNITVMKLKSLNNFIKDEDIFDASIMRIVQIGELTHFKLDKEIKIMLFSIPWKQIWGMRNVLVHEYYKINYKLVWEVMNENINDIIFSLSSILDI